MGEAEKKNKYRVINTDSNIHNTVETRSTYLKWEAWKLILGQTIA